jgi:hypothetical protein
MGERVRAYARVNDGNLPSTTEEFLRLGLIAPGELTYDDLTQGVRIRRQVRPVPRTDYPRNLILILEVDEPYCGRIGILYLDGQAVLGRNLSLTLREDNALRIRVGLLPVDFP